MKITDFLAPAAITHDLPGCTATDVLTELCRPIAATTGVDAERLVEALLARERLGSTGIGDGLAIPHAKLPGIPALVGSFGRSRTGIDFKAIDSKPSTLFFVLFAPTAGPGLHLNALARISRIFKSAAFRESILSAKDAADICRLIEAEDGT